MKKIIRNNVFVFLLLLSCRKLYNPPAISAPNHFLAIDGLIHTGSNSVSSFTVNHSLNLTDTVPDLPELEAEVFIQGSDGSRYYLIDTGRNGIYVSEPLNLDTNKNFQLVVNSKDGNKYISDFVHPKYAPPIDSVTWELVHDPITSFQAVNIYVNAHDSSNNTRYYRWDYLDTYKYVATYHTSYGLVGGTMIVAYPVGYSTDSCYSTLRSGNIILGSTVTLSQDQVSHMQIANYPQNDLRMDVGNSILVRQYPLTLESYMYWLTVQKNSQSLGGIFDIQPAQINGNIHCVNNPKNPVLGYISASSVQTSRIYISNKSLPGWKSNRDNGCPIRSIGTDPTNVYHYTYSDTSYGPYYFAGDLVIAQKSCMYCLYQGGTLEKPAYWPHYD